MQCIQCADGQHGAHGPGSRRCGDHLGHDGLHGSRKTATAIVRILGNGAPASLNKLVPRRTESLGGCYHPVGDGAALLIANPVDRGHHLGHEPAQFVKNAVDSLRINMLVSREVADGRDVADLVENESDVF